MIKQKKIIEISNNTNLSYSDIGEVISNSTSLIKIILPNPFKGAWFRIINIGEDILIKINNNLELTLKQSEQILLLSSINSPYQWYYNKGNALSVEDIENILSGDITSHYHDTRYYTKIEVQNLLNNFKENSIIYEPLTNGSIDNTELLFCNGDIIMGGFK